MSTIVNDLVSHLQCGTSIAANDAVYIDSSDGKIYKFSATDDTQVFAGIAKEAGVLNDFIRVVQSGRVKGFTGLTPGQFVYASTTVPGSFQLVEPAASQKVILGIAKSATELTINGGLGIKPGGDGSGGGLDAFYVEDMEGLADVADFATGNNAAFLGGGTLQGTLALESVSPISGLKSLKYTQAAGSLNDYFASELIEIDPKQQDNTSGMTLYFTYNGNDNDMKFVVWDVTNSRELSNQVSFVKLANSATRYSLSFYVPQSCTQIRWGAQVLVANSGKILLVDDVEMSTDPFHEAELLQTQSIFYSTSSAVLANATVANLALTSSYGSGIFSWNNTTGIGTVLRQGVFTLSYSSSANSASAITGVVVINGVDSAVDTSFASSGFFQNAAWTGVLDVGATFSFRSANASSTQQKVLVSATASTSHILTPSDTFSTDTAPLTYAGSSQYTLATLANAPIGTFITFTYAANTNTRTQTNAAPPTQTTASMNQNGIQIFTRAYTAASTAGNPAAIAIQIGKGLKGHQLNLYKSAGKVTSGDLDFTSLSTTADSGAIAKSYNEATGVLVVDVGWTSSASVTVRVLNFIDVSAATSGYLTINAGKTLPLLAVPVPLVGYLKDVKPSGTAGGTATAGSYLTRTLNTVEGDFNKFGTLSVNQFTLGPGRYEIIGSAPITAPPNGQSSARVIIKNITLNSTSLVGQSAFAGKDGGSEQSTTICNILGIITITNQNVFELQQFVSHTQITNGLGNPVGGGEPEVYAQVKITKLS